MNSSFQCSPFKKHLLTFCLFIYALIICNTANAQFKPLSPGKGVSLENPPRPIKAALSITIVQNLNFGTVYNPGITVGTVYITPEGARHTTGDIIPIGGSFSAACFDVESIPGTIVTITESSATLNGNNGGTLKLEIGNHPDLNYSDFKSPFVTTAETTTIFIGGTLTVGPLGTNPAGNYNGTFFITFIQQ